MDRGAWGGVSSGLQGEMRCNKDSQMIMTGMWAHTNTHTTYLIRNQPFEFLYREGRGRSGGVERTSERKK